MPDESIIRTLGSGESSGFIYFYTLHDNYILNPMYGYDDMAPPFIFIGNHLAGSSSEDQRNGAWCFTHALSDPGHLMFFTRSKHDDYLGAQITYEKAKAMSDKMVRWNEYRVQIGLREANAEMCAKLTNYARVRSKVPALSEEEKALIEGANQIFSELLNGTEEIEVVLSAVELVSG